MITPGLIKDAKITKLSNIQTVNFILVLICYHTKAILRIVLEKKRLMRHIFRKYASIFLCTPCHDVHKQVTPLQNLTRARNAQITMLQNHRILRGSRVPKS